MNTERLAQIKAALAPVIPQGWRTRLTTRDRYVVLTISRARIDLVAVDRVAYPHDGPAKGFVKICPTAYETPWDDASAAIGAIWRAMDTGNTVQFDRHGDRAGEFHFRELWIGSPSKRFEVTQ